MPAALQFKDLSVGETFDHRGRRYTKIAVSLATAENGDDYIFMGEIEVNLSTSELWETAAALSQ
jgi:hypothetical protein